MSAHSVGIFNFEFWEGPPPVLVSQQGTTFHRPGANGIGQQTVGRWSEPFEVTLTQWNATYLVALDLLRLMKQLVRSDPVRVRYNNIDYRQRYRHVYLVDELHEVSCQAVPRMLGPGINLLGGAELIVRCVFTPMEI